MLEACRVSRALASRPSMTAVRARQFDRQGDGWVYLYAQARTTLVDNKIHARSIGPYSLVTQQPLGRQGPVRRSALRRDGSVGSRSLWSGVYAPGNAHHQVGRRCQAGPRSTKSIVRGDDTFEAGHSRESFNVLVKEIRSLGLNVELEMADEYRRRQPGGPEADQLAPPQERGGIKLPALPTPHSFGSLKERALPALPTDKRRELMNHSFTTSWTRSTRQVPVQTFDQMKINDRLARRRISQLVLWRDQEARDHQLSHVQA